MSEIHGFLGDATDLRYYSQVRWLPFVRDILIDGYVSGNGDELEVTAQTPAAMAVDVGTGAAWIQGNRYASSASEPLTIEAAHATLPRIDRIIIRNAITGARTITLMVLKGTAAATPAGTDLTRDDDIWDLCLAEVAVAAGATSISAVNVTDKRSDNTLCGVATPLAVRLADIIPGDVLDMAGYRVEEVATPSADTDGVNLAYRNAAALAEPVGIIDAFAGTTIPEGWLECDGSTFNSTTYPDLYSALGTTTLPDLRGRSIAGYNSAETEFDAIGETGGEKTHTLTEAEIPAHVHSGCAVITYSSSGGLTGSYTDYSAKSITTIGAAGGGAAHNNLPPYIVMKMIIKAVA